jgi:hypothetical protein
MWRHVDLVCTDVSEELIAFLFRVVATCSSETSVHTRSTECHIPEDGVLHIHCRENPKSYNFLVSFP